MSGDKIDRREQGVKKVTVSDGNGGSDETYQVSVKKMRAWVGLVSAVLAAVVTVVGGVAAGVRYGVGTEVHQAIEDECDPGGMIDDSIQQTAYEMGEEIQGVIQDDLDDLDTRMGAVEATGVRLEAGQEGIASQQARDQEELRMLLQRAIAE